MTRRLLGPALAIALAALLSLAPAAAGFLLPPPKLTVWDGEDGWHPKREFLLIWRAPDVGIGSSPSSVDYQIRDSLGNIVVGQRRLPWPVIETRPQVPPLPGAYTVEVWFEGTAQLTGPASTVVWRFDDEPPAKAEPVVGEGWIGRNGFPLTIHIRYPAGSRPLSGIRGYAVSVDSTEGGRPCAAALRCTPTETDLAGGANDDSLWIPELAEGTSYLHVVAVSGSGIGSAEVGTAALRVDKTAPSTRLDGVPPGWVDHPVTLSATATDGGSGMQPDGGGATPFTAIAIDGGTPILAAGDNVVAQVAGEGVHSVAYYASDLAGNVDDGETTNGRPNPPPATARVRIDRTSPAVAFADAQDPFEPELIRAWIGDALSGIDPDDGWIGIRRAASGDAFRALPLLPAPSGELRARWDSDSYPPGRYEFEAGVRDRAGNLTTTVRRADGSAMALSDPLKAPTAVSATLGGGASATRHVPFGRGVPLTGRLSVGGQPLAGAPLRIVERLDGGELRESTVWSGPGGDFEAPLAAGPSREAFAVFDGSPTLTRATSRPLRLAVRSSLRLRTSSAEARVGGRPLVFSGRVAAAPGTIPKAGKAVELQFRLPGLPWREFRTLRSDRRGRFRYAYRFSDDDSRGVAFQFRAYAPPQDGWPYEPGSSPTVVVRGR